MSNQEPKSERIRKARSVNDLLGVTKDIAMSISKIRTNTMTSESAEPKSIIIDHTQELGAVKTPVNLGAKLSKFKMPNVALIAKHSKHLQVLHESASDIDAIIASLTHTFEHAKSKAAALRAATSVQKETHKAINTVATALNAIAEKHVPEQLRTFAEEIESKLHNIIAPEKYSDISMELYVNADDVVKTKSGTMLATLEFCYYVVMHDLVMDDDSDSQPIEEYCVMLTGIVKDDSIRYYMNAVPEFMPPGKYPIGKEIRTGKDLAARLKLLLSIHKIVGVVNQRTMPYDNTSAKVESIKGFPNVESVDVVDDALIVNMITSVDGRGSPRDSEKSCQEVIKRVLPLLMPITGANKASPVRSKYEIVREAETKVGKKIVPRKTYIKFVLIGRPARDADSSDLAATKEHLEDLKHALDLSDKETGAIRKILIHHRG